MSLRSSEMSNSNSAELEGEVIDEEGGLGEEEEDNERPGVFNAEVDKHRQPLLQMKLKS